MLLGVYYMAMSAGRFAGPLVMGAATFISTPAGQTNVCTTGWIVAPDGSISCDGPPDQQCAITGGFVVCAGVPVAFCSCS